MTIIEEAVVPGEFACPECGFVVVKSIINPTTGDVGRDAKDRLEQCPNDRSILRPVKYADALTEARKAACEHMAKARTGEQMEVLLHNLVVRGRLYGHEKQAAENLLKDWQELQA